MRQQKTKNKTAVEQQAAQQQQTTMPGKQQ